MLFNSFSSTLFAAEGQPKRTISIMAMSDMRSAISGLEIENFEHKPFVPYHRKITDIIRNGGFWLFATLATIGNIGCITRFIRADQFSDVQSDSKMPLSEASISKILPDTPTCTQFFREQWKFLSPIFETGQLPREYYDRTVLPFLSCVHIYEGGFSSVSKVKVDISHHRITSNVIEVS